MAKKADSTADRDEWAQASEGDAPNPTMVTAARTGDALAGVHPTRRVSDASHHAGEYEYRDLPDDQKPDAATVAQEQVLPDPPEDR